MSTHSEYDVLIVVSGDNLLERKSIDALRNLIINLQFVDGMDGEGFGALHAARTAVTRAALSEAAVQVPIAPPPPFKLIGVAEEAGPDGPVRTAIIAAPGQVFLVKEGDAVASRYRVTKISAEVVELVEPGDAPPLRLSLR